MPRFAMLTAALILLSTTACQDQGPSYPTGEGTTNDQGGDAIVQRASGLLTEKTAPSITDSMQKELGPCAKSPGADLKIVGHEYVGHVNNPSRTFLIVKNVGNVEAVFTKSGKLISNSQTGLSNDVPSGGKIQPGATHKVESRFRLLCDLAGNTLDADQWVGHAMDWPSSWPVPDPIQSSGMRPYYVDPLAAVAECDETNNTYVLKVPSPIKKAGGMIGTRQPDLIVTDVVSEQKLGPGNEPTIYQTVKLKNQGTRTAVFCATLENYNSPFLKSVKVMPEGEQAPQGTYSQAFHSPHMRPYVIQPGTTVDIELTSKKLSTTSEPDKWGVVTTSPGFTPGCHEMKITIDTKGEIAESNECNNATIYYLEVGGVKCPADKQTHTINTCPFTPKKPSTFDKTKTISPTRR